jgi:dipeptidyl aminopeptidase/acylaminoacyl peptidase
VAGYDPDAEPERFERLCPDRNVTPDYPPTMLLHGTADTDVPYQLSAAMAGALTRAGVSHEFATVAGAGHGFSGASTSEVAALFDRVVTFLNRHVR